MPLNSNYYADLNRFQLNATAQTLSAAIGGTIYLSIFGVPNEFNITRMRIIEDGNLSLLAADAVDIVWLSDPGKYREAEAAAAGSGEPYVLASIDDATSEVAPNTYWLYDDIFDPPLTVKDNLKSNCMHFKLSSDAALSSDADFTIYIEGYSLPELYTTAHSIGQARHDNRLLKVLRNDVAADAWYEMGNTINPDYNKNAAITPFILDTDYVYFGMEEQWNGLWFNINSQNTTTGITETWEYWDGSAWQTLTVRNNCTDDETTAATSFCNSSVIEWDTPATWTIDTIDNAAMVTTEPPYDYPNSNLYAQKWMPRYWIRANIDDVSTTPTFYWIREKASVI